MSHPFRQMLAWVQLTRLPLMATAISNIWLVVFWSETVERDLAAGQPALPVRLGLTALTAGGLYVFGMTLNDVMDLRRDRALAPMRPLASGRLRPAAALLTALGALLIAVAAAVPLGMPPALLCLGCAGLIVLYDGGLKYVPGVGLLLLGLIRAANMLVADPGLAYLWPVWVTFSHVVGLSALAYALERKRPLMNAGHVMALIVGYAFWSLALIGWMSQRGDVPEVGLAWLGAAAAASGFLLVGRWRVARAGSAQAAGQALMRTGLLWLIVYDLAWLAAVGEPGFAAAHGALLAAALTGMHLLRRAAGPGSADRVGYRMD